MTKLRVYLPQLYTFVDPTLIFSDTITIKSPSTYINILNGSVFPLTLFPDKSAILQVFKKYRFSLDSTHSPMRRAVISISVSQMSKLRLRKVNECLKVQENSRARSENKFHVILTRSFAFLHAGVQGHISWCLQTGI